jgi:hypothetical protein
VAAKEATLLGGSDFNGWNPEEGVQNKLKNGTLKVFLI